MYKLSALTGQEMNERCQLEDHKAKYGMNSAEYRAVSDLECRAYAIVVETEMQAYRPAFLRGK